MKRSNLNRIMSVAMVATIAASTATGGIGAIGDVYVSSSNGGILQYNGVTGDFVGVFAEVQDYTFMSHKWGGDGNLYAAGFRGFGDWEVFKFDGNTGANLGSVVSSSPGFSLAKGIAFGINGDLFVGDWAAQEISRYDGTTFAHQATYVGGFGTPLGTPNGMTIAPNGDLLVVSGGFQQVLSFDVSNLGIDLEGVYADVAPAAQPQDIAYGPNGDLFVTGGNNGGVLRIDGQTGDVLGFFVPEGLSNNGLVFDSHGRLLVATVDGSDNSRVIAYDALTGELLGDFFSPGAGGMGSPGFISIKPIPAPSAFIAFALAAPCLTRRRR